MLAIDCAPQSSLSIVLGIDPQQLRQLDTSGKTLYHGLVKDKALSSLIVSNTPDLSRS